MNLPNRELPRAGQAVARDAEKTSLELPPENDFFLGLGSGRTQLSLSISVSNHSTPFVPKSTHRTLQRNNPSSLQIRGHHTMLCFDDLGLVVVVLVELGPINQGLGAESSQEEKMEGRYRGFVVRLGWDFGGEFLSVGLGWDFGILGVRF